MSPDILTRDASLEGSPRARVRVSVIVDFVKFPEGADAEGVADFMNNDA